MTFDAESGASRITRGSRFWPTPWAPSWPGTSFTSFCSLPACRRFGGTSRLPSTPGWSRTSFFAWGSLARRDGCGRGFDPPAGRGYYYRIMSRRTLLGWSAVAAAGWLLAACGEPIVARSPEALYALAQQQIANASYSPAADTLARVVLAG